MQFAYEPERQILKDVNISCPMGSFTAIVGESGCGKSTFAGILMRKNENYKGDITIGGVQLSDISESSLMEHIAYIQGYSKR